MREDSKCCKANRKSIRISLLSPENRITSNFQLFNQLIYLHESFYPNIFLVSRSIPMCSVSKRPLFPLQVLRQTTLPIVPTRHQTFQRQLSHRLDMPGNIQFSICSLEQRSNSSIVGLIKVRLSLAGSSPLKVVAGN